MLITEEDERLNLENKKIVVIGTGYVGFPAAVLLAKAGCKVIGVDVDKNSIALAKILLTAQPRIVRILLHAMTIVAVGKVQ